AVPPGGVRHRVRQGHLDVRMHPGPGDRALDHHQVRLAPLLSQPAARTKSGSFFSYGSERLGQGRNNAKGYLDTHPEVAKEIEGKIYEILGVSQDLVTP